MTQTPGISAQANRTLFVAAAAGLDIERICREYGEQENPPEAFMVRSEAIEGQLLAINLAFLERGQLLPHPGLPLAGAAFDPGWGFSQAEVCKRRDGLFEFRLPSLHFETLASGDIYGYRMSIIDDHEVPEAMGQLADIRRELARRRSETQKRGDIRVRITQV
jgi:hypothetical protein